MLALQKVFKLLPMIVFVALFSNYSKAYSSPSGEEIENVVKQTVSIDAGKIGEPISKYIYGQFIEHLGRCIYGGLWAEMLEDRKFYFPVTDDFNAWSATAGDGPIDSDEFLILVGSPWRVIGGKNVVKMVSENSYVGKYTPEIYLKGNGEPYGISQGNLGLIKDKEYAGRIAIAGDPEATPIEVSLIWGESKNERQTVIIKKLNNSFIKIPLKFKSGATTNEGKFEIVGRGKHKFRIGVVSLMPADNVEGMRKETLALLKELNAPIYRWPGGCFVGGYNWRDGLGDPDKRPPHKNTAWSGIEPNDFGIHEFIRFCRYLNTEPFIAVDTGIGSAKFAADEVEYTNSDTATPMGKLRASNGHPEPFNVKWWACGNEMFGEWQRGYMPLKDYIKKHNETAKAMWAVDSTIKLIAVGSFEVKDWSKRMLSNCANYMNLISEHLYWSDKETTIEHVAQVPTTIKEVVKAHEIYRKTLRSLAGKDIRIAMDEWNYSREPHAFGELGCRFYLKDALGIAAGLHEFYRNSDIIYMANYAQTVNVLGCIKTNKTTATLATTGLVLKLYRNQFGVLPVEVSGVPESLDIAAAWMKDRDALTIGIVNPTEVKYEINLNLENAQLTGKGQHWLITGSDAMAHNEPGEKPRVAIKENQLFHISNKLRVGPLSINLYKLSVLN